MEWRELISADVECMVGGQSFLYVALCLGPITLSVHCIQCVVSRVCGRA